MYVPTLCMYILKNRLKKFISDRRQNDHSIALTLLQNTKTKNVQQQRVLPAAEKPGVVSR